MSIRTGRKNRNKPMSEAPLGLCRIHDKVLFEGKAWRISKTGISNDHGYPLDIELRGEDDAIRIVSAHGDVIIYPPVQEVPANLAAFAKAEELEVVRVPSNGADFVYELYCPRCGERPWLSLTTYEGASVLYAEGSFYNRRPEITDSETEYHCNCPNGVYPLPDGFEVNWG